MGDDKSSLEQPTKNMDDPSPLFLVAVVTVAIVLVVIWAIFGRG